MDRQRFDALLQETLEEKSMEVSMSENRKEQIRQSIRNQSEEQAGFNKEETIMRLGFKKKVVLVAAAMCVFGTMAALAAGKIASYTGGTNPDKPDYKTFAELSAVEEQTGFPVKAVETFENGFRFIKGHKVNIEAQDDAGNVVESFPEVNLRYEKGNQHLTISAQKVRDMDVFEGNVKATEYKGRSLQYKEDKYMFVPPSYEPTEEEKKAEEAGELYISYGTEEVEYLLYHFMQWDDNGTRYLMLSSDENAPGQEEMEKMAQQVIDSSN